MKGEIVSHGREKRRVSKVALERLNSGTQEGSRLIFFQAVPLATSGQEAREALRVMKQKGSAGGWRPW
jgi:hypothetical protein